MGSNFNPRSPSGLRPMMVQVLGEMLVFQSTQPEWAATGSRWTAYSISDISIHAARVGCDGTDHGVKRADVEFQSTQPVWAATPLH